MNRCAAVVLAVFLSACTPPELKVVASKSHLLANGYDESVLKIYGSKGKPGLQISAGPAVIAASDLHVFAGHWEAILRAGVMPGMVMVRADSQGRHAGQKLTLEPQITDSGEDGTPDFARLDDTSDQQTFRTRMTYLAELQYFKTPGERASEITDCSALVRYSYREALRKHAGLCIRKYNFPYTLLGASILRTRAGTYSPADLKNGGFAEFADAQTLQRFNSFYVSRDLAQAQPADLLFYRRRTAHGLSYHSMIFLGKSQIKPDENDYVVYHTGPDGTSSGEIRRLTLAELLHFPDPQWHPIAANPFFLGVYRWNILKVPQ